MLIARYDPRYCLNDFGTRKLKYAFHDIDGTHSLIRNWPPVMSIVLYDVIQNGLPNDFDSPANRARLIDVAGKKPLPETDRFCVDSAGLSALTQMEWSIRRAVVEGSIAIDCDQASNEMKIRLINDGQERFPDLPDSPALSEILTKYTPRLFKLYEAVLNGYCRDKNLAEARENPEKYRVQGSMRFLKALKNAGVRNYFVTGAVVERGMGMFEEVETLGYQIGPDCVIEDIIGSTWDCKMPKDEIMTKLCQQLNASGDEILVTGDGRSEISAGVQMNALTISRLPIDAYTQRSLHQKLGTCMIVERFDIPAINKVFIRDNTE